MDEWAVVILFRMQTVRSAGPYKTEPCGLNDTSPESLLTILQELKIKQAMASSYIAPRALEGRSSQIYDLDWDDQKYISEDGTPVFKLHDCFESIIVLHQHELLWHDQANHNPTSRQTSHSG
jgi:hypothetical protein